VNVAAEILDQFLAPLAGIDPAAVERERPVESMAAPEDRAPCGEMGGKVADRRVVADRRRAIAG
jgi:hypothetical protein